MCFGGDDPPQAPNNAPTYAADQAKAGAAAAEIAKSPAQDDSLTKTEKAPASSATSLSSTSGASVNSLKM